MRYGVYLVKGVNIVRGLEGKITLKINARRTQDLSPSRNMDFVGFNLIWEGENNSVE